jgi:nucleoside 2-deoxyribosyltransferase
VQNFFFLQVKRNGKQQEHKKFKEKPLTMNSGAVVTAGRGDNFERETGGGRSMTIRKPAVYFAGKIGPNDWRHRLIPKLRSVTGGNCCVPGPALFDPVLTLDCGDFIYTGPFFIACDNDYARGSAPHAAATCAEVRHGLHHDQRAALHREVFAINRRRLSRADLVFAFLESADCYGTLIELGWAHAWGKPIALRLPDDDAGGELWMAAQAARRVYQGSAAACLGQFRRDFLSVAPDAWRLPSSVEAARAEQEYADADEL